MENICKFAKIQGEMGGGGLFFSTDPMHYEFMCLWFIMLRPLLNYCSKSIVSKISFKNTTRVSNRCEPDQDSVGPDLGPNCLQRHNM